MVAVPANMPLTMPVVKPTDAVVRELLPQLPPAVGLPSMVVAPAHSPDAPVMAPGCGLMVIGFVAVQPVPSE